MDGMGGEPGGARSRQRRGGKEMERIGGRRYMNGVASLCSDGRRRICLPTCHLVTWSNTAGLTGIPVALETTWVQARDALMSVSVCVNKKWHMYVYVCVSFRGVGLKAEVKFWLDLIAQ